MNILELLKKIDFNSLMSENGLDFDKLASALTEKAKENNHMLILNNKETNEWIPRKSLDEKTEEFEKTIKQKDEVIQSQKTTIDNLEPLANNAESYKKAKGQLEEDIKAIKENSQKEINEIKLKNAVKDIAKDKFKAKPKSEKFILEIFNFDDLSLDNENFETVATERLKKINEEYDYFFESDNVTGDNVNHSNNNNNNNISIGKRLAQKRKQRDSLATTGNENKSYYFNN